MKPKFEIKKIAGVIHFCTMCESSIIHDRIWELRFNLGGSVYIFNLCDQHAQELQTLLKKKEG